MSWTLWKQEITEQLNAHPQLKDTPLELAAYKRYLEIHPENGQGYFLEEIGKNDPQANKTLKKELTALKSLISPSKYRELINYYYSNGHFKGLCRQPITYPLLAAIEAQNWNMFHFLIQQGAILERNAKYYYRLARFILISNDEEVLGWYFSLKGVVQTDAVLQALYDCIEQPMRSYLGDYTQSIRDLLKFADTRRINLFSSSLALLDKALSSCAAPNSSICIEIIRILQAKFSIPDVIISKKAINLNQFEVAKAYWSQCKKDLEWELLSSYPHHVMPIEILSNCIKHEIFINWNKFIKNLNSLTNLLARHSFEKGIFEFIFLLEAEKQLDRNILDNYIKKNSQKLPTFFLFAWMLNRGNFFAFRNNDKINICITGIETEHKLSKDINAFASSNFQTFKSCFFTYRTNDDAALKSFRQLAPLYLSRGALVKLKESRENNTQLFAPRVKTDQIEQKAKTSTLLPYFDTFSIFHSNRIVNVEDNLTLIPHSSLDYTPCRSLRTITLARLSQSLTKLPGTLPQHVKEEIEAHREALQIPQIGDLTAHSNQLTETGFNRDEPIGYELLRDKYLNFMEVSDEPHEEALYTTLRELPGEMQAGLEDLLCVPEDLPSIAKPHLFSAQASSSQEKSRGQKRKAPDTPFD